MSGYHEIVYDDGDQYKGEWSADGKVSLSLLCLLFTIILPNLQREGYGILSFADGSKYAGTFTNGLCAGLGVLTYPGMNECIISRAISHSVPA